MRIFACMRSSVWYNRRKLSMQLNIWFAYATYKNKRRLINQPSFSKNLSHTFLCCYFMGKFLTCLTLSAILQWDGKTIWGLLKIYGSFCAPFLAFFLQVTLLPLEIFLLSLFFFNLINCCRLFMMYFDSELIEIY